MTTRIVDMPVLASRPAEMDATIYNLWRRARLHLQIPLRLSLPGLAQMILILYEDSWVVVNESQNDLPVLAWVDFEDSHRDSLHKPIPCTLNFYHYMASSLRGKVLERMEAALEKRLQEDIS
ncbi:MAG TPA: hypothetical protein EYP51_08125 [Thiotrichales bacterium]|nr:hypothetical protein [Thiotrichales bacterium]